MKITHFKLLFSLTTFFLVSQLFSQNIVSSFNSNFTSGCSPLVVDFNNTSTNSNQYKWDFGNGSSSILENPSTTFTLPGLYTVTLISLNASGSDTLVSTNYIEVFDLPSSDFSFSSNTDYCSSTNEISFTNSTVGALSYIWDFGDGNTSTQSNPIHNYANDGSYTVKLVSYNSNNCANQKTVGPINIKPIPEIIGSVDFNFNCDSSYTFNFNTNVSNVSTSNFLFEYGDGTSENSINSSASHSYNSYGTFNPKVIAKSVDGCIDSSIIEEIYLPSPLNYSLINNESNGCSPLVVDFQLTPNSTVDSIYWNFGDTTIVSSLFNINHTYNADGSFNPLLTIYDTSGCVTQYTSNITIEVDPLPTASFQIANNVGCPPLLVQFNSNTAINNTINWDFGDTTFSNQSNPSHTYVYNNVNSPKLQVTSPNGCQSLFSLPDVNVGMVLNDFSVDKSTGCAPMDVTFTANAPANATTYLWDFGDGNTSSDLNPDHTYDTIGKYGVRFTCWDSLGCEASYFIDEMIETFGEDDVVFPETDTIQSCSPYTYYTDAINIGQSFWNWDFGDGAVDTGASPSHTYNIPGNYLVQLNADAPNGCMYNSTEYAYIMIDGMTIDLDISVDSDCDGGSIQVTNNSSGIAHHHWYFGDNSADSSSTISHDYPNTSQSYVVSYTAISNSGCINKQYIPVIFSCGVDTTIAPPASPLPMPANDPIVLLTDPNTNAPISQNCGPQEVNLSSPFSTAQTFLWEFGDGGTSTDKNPYYQYNSSGTFDLTHYAYHLNGDVDTMVITEFIDQYIFDADFQLSKTELCNEAEFNYTSTSSGIASWDWKIDGVSINTSSFGSLILPLTDSVKQLTLTAIDSFGCIDEKHQSLFLYQPILLVDQDTLICFGSPLNIESSSIADYSYSWDLDDGTTINNDTAISHTYASAGTYNVKLLLTDSNGCVRTENIEPVLVKPIDSDFAPTSVNPICKGDTLSFSAVDLSNSSYVWTGGSVIGSGSSVNIVFNSAGLQVVKLTATKDGCSYTSSSDSIVVNEAKAYFTFEQLNGCLPIEVNFSDSSINPVQWNWDFGDGNTSTNVNPNHTYFSMPNDSITLTITDNNGCQKSISNTIINSLDAIFTAGDTLVCHNTPVTFSTTNPAINIWNWDFGDGSTSTLSNPSHQYDTTGIYTVSLFVSDGQGCEDSVIKTDYVQVKGVNSSFTFSAPSQCPPVVTSFANSSADAVSYIWDFGDGANSTIENPTHIYTNSGSYQIMLMATNNMGCVDTLLHPDSILIPGPIVDFNVNQLTGCDSLTISISNNSLNTTSYSFDFGDGSSSQLINPSHTYSQSGTFNITLVAEDSSGCQSFLTYPNPVVISPSPTINFSLPGSDFCINEVFQIQNLTTNADSYEWSFDLQNFTNSSPSFTVNNQGVLPIKLLASNSNGCKDSTFAFVTGHYTPPVSILDPGITCINEGNIQLSSSNAQSINNIYWTGEGIVDSVSGYFNPTISSNSKVIAYSNDICSSIDSIEIQVESPPDPTILSGEEAFCYGQTIPIPLTKSPNGNWSGTNVNPLTGAITNFLSVGTHYHTHITQSQNCSDTSQYSIVIKHQPNASIIGPSSICDNINSIQLSASDSGGIWTGTSINSNGTVDVSNLTTGTHTYTHVISGFCNDSASFDIEVHKFIEAEIIDPQPVCEGTDTVEVSTMKNYGVWSGLTNNHLGNGVFKVDQLDEGSYPVYYTLGTVCPDTDTSFIIINPEPNIDVDITQSLPCISYPIEIQNNSTNSNNENYSWFINDSLYSNEFSPVFNLPIGIHQFKIHAVNQFICENEVLINEEVIIYDTTALPSPEIIRSTVLDDIDVYTEWFPKESPTNKVKEYVVFKSDGQNEEYEYITTLDNTINHYTDENVDVFENSYTYYIVSVNQCNITSNASNISSSVLLGYDKPNDFQTILKWTSYKEWKEGVNRYEIQKLNEYGQWEVFKVVNHDVNQILIDE